MHEITVWLDAWTCTCGEGTETRTPGIFAYGHRDNHHVEQPATITYVERNKR